MHHEMLRTKAAAALCLALTVALADEPPEDAGRYSNIQPNHPFCEGVGTNECRLRVEVQRWLLMTLPAYETLGEMEYRMSLFHQNDGFVSRLYEAEFRLTPAAQQSVRDAWKKADQLHALDTEAAETYYRKLIHGQTPNGTRPTERLWDRELWKTWIPPSTDP